ncbi:MAG: stress response translation initiation inhibitor YciH [Dehalococcoidia bacterium]|nr:stress response translation initiation inhibitor YciH [Dehalococcoidia bacterium]
MTAPRPDSRLVYSTDGTAGAGRDLRKAAPPAVSRAAASAPPNDGVVRVQRDRRGRGGKTATTVAGLPGGEADLDLLLRRLKQTLGTGGSREARVLVFQGDQRDRLVEALGALGHRVKVAGG